MDHHAENSAPGKDGSVPSLVSVLSFVNARRYFLGYFRSVATIRNGDVYNNDGNLLITNHIAHLFQSVCHLVYWILCACEICARTTFASPKICLGDMNISDLLHRQQCTKLYHSIVELSHCLFYLVNIYCLLLDIDANHSE